MRKRMETDLVEILLSCCQFERWQDTVSTKELDHDTV